MSWPFLIYLIDVLTTDGTYGGWGFLMFISGVAFVGLYAFQRCYEHEKRTEGTGWSFYDGQVLTLTSAWNGYPVGTQIELMSVWNHDKTVRVKFPNNRFTDNDVKQSTIAKVTQNTTANSQPEQIEDVTKGPRRIAVFGMVICFIGILYANFMPQKETAYKMLAAYVGQNVVESPRTQQLADSTIKYLDAQIKKYTEELDATAKAEQAAKEKEEKESN